MPIDFSLTEEQRQLQALARRVGVSRQWIIEVEKGKRSTRLGLILRTFEVLGLDLRTGDPPAAPARGFAPATAVDIDRLIEAHRGQLRRKP